MGNVTSESESTEHYGVASATCKPSIKPIILVGMKDGQSQQSINVACDQNRKTSVFEFRIDKDPGEWHMYTYEIETHTTESRKETLVIFKCNKDCEASHKISENEQLELFKCHKDCEAVHNISESQQQVLLVSEAGSDDKLQPTEDEDKDGAVDDGKKALRLRIGIVPECENLDDDLPKCSTYSTCSICSTYSAMIFRLLRIWDEFGGEFAFFESYKHSSYYLSVLPGITKPEDWPEGIDVDENKVIGLRKLTTDGTSEDILIQLEADDYFKLKIED